MELLATDGVVYSRELQSSLNLLRLTQSKMQELTTLRIPSTLSTSATVPTVVIEPDREELVSCFSHLQSEFSGNLSEIIGCERAKRSLRENIVNHLSLGEREHSIAFSGIR